MLKNKNQYVRSIDIANTMNFSKPSVSRAIKLSWEVEYLYDNTASTSDYRVLKALEKAGAIVDVEVTFPDNTVFKNKGYVTTTVTGAEVNQLVKAKAIVNLQGEWETTNPAA